MRVDVTGSSRGEAKRYEVRQIFKDGEKVLASFDDLKTDAFDYCIAMWATRRTGGSPYAVRDSETEQRWSYADIKELQRSWLAQERWEGECAAAEGRATDHQAAP